MSYKCQVCEKKFSTVNSLAAHRRWCALSAHSIIDINKGNPLTTEKKEREEQHVLDGDNEVDAAVPINNVNTSILLRQDSILKSCSMFTATMKEGCMLSVMLRLYLFGEQVSLSNSEGTMLLELVKSAFPGVASDQLPNSFDTLQGKVDKYFTDEYDIKRTVIKFPSSFSSSDVNVYEGHYVDILILIGDMLLDLCLEDLHMEPSVLVDSSNNRIIREPSTGLDFQHMFKYVTENMEWTSFRCLSLWHWMSWP